MKRLQILLVLSSLIIAGPVFAKDVYVAQTSSGAASGADCSDAYALSWLNTASNWVPGETIHLCGTITGAPNSTAITVPASGTSGSPITIYFEPGAVLTSPVWNANGAISLGTNSYITINGASGGHITNTLNGSSGNTCQAGSCQYQQDSQGITGNGGNNIVIENLLIDHIYDRASGSTTDTNRFGESITLSGGSNIQILNNNLYDGDTLIGYVYNGGPWSNLTISGNTVERCNHGITLGASSGTPQLSNVTIANNTIDWLQWWNGVSGNHLDGMIIFNEAPNNAGYINGLNIYDNTIGPNIGQINTSAVFIDTYAASQIQNMKVYNNVFTQISPYAWSNGFIAVGGSAGALIANNTFVSYDTGALGTSAGIGLSISQNDTNTIIEDNLFYSVGTPINCGPGNAWPPSLTSNYNIFWDYNTAGGSGAFYFPSYNAMTWALWQAQGYDANSLTGQPQLASNYSLLSTDTVAKGHGTSLAADFTTDIIGVSRTQGTGWDIGAYESKASAGLTAPSGLRLVQ